MGPPRVLPDTNLRQTHHHHHYHQAHIRFITTAFITQMQQDTEFIIKMEFKIHVLNLVLIYQSVSLSLTLIEEHFLKIKQLDMTTSVNLIVDRKTCLACENV